MNFKEMSIEDLETRKSAIASEIETDGADLDALEEEVRGINAELEARKAEEAKKAEIRSAVAAGQGTVVKEFKIEEKRMNITEIRNSEEYINAFANYAKTGDATECRALLSDNSDNGVVPVPTFVADMVAERVKESKILSRVRRMNAPGNVKVGFEISAPAAAYHSEGGGEQAEEALVLGTVELIPITLKKWVGISDEALDSMSGRQYLEYLYNEITRGIIKARERVVVMSIDGASTENPAETKAPRVKQLFDDEEQHTPTITDFVEARALLSAAAEDLVIIISPALYAKYKGLQLSGTYGADPFDGIEVIVSEFAEAPLIGDLNGVMENLPKGDTIEFKYDDRTLMTSDMVRVLGRLPVATMLVGSDYFAKVNVVVG